MNTTNGINQAVNWVTTQLEMMLPLTGLGRGGEGEGTGRGGEDEGTTFAFPTFGLAKRGIAPGVHSKVLNDASGEGAIA